MATSSRPRHRHPELHRSSRADWLRAAVLGANDGIVSTASLVIGVAASDAARSAVLVAGSAGLVAGALSMAAGEYVSVSSQRDAERADIDTERRELREAPDHELNELIGIYRSRGLDDDLARQVAVQLTEHDALGTHLRDELGIDREDLANPLQAALVSALAFILGGVLPFLTMMVAGRSVRIVATGAVCLAALALLGGLGGRLGGAPTRPAALRVALGGAAAMAITFVVGDLVGGLVG